MRRKANGKEIGDALKIGVERRKSERKEWKKVGKQGWSGGRHKERQEGMYGSVVSG